MAVYFGVRHFSPACAFFVREFLEREKPDVLLIEGPSDLSGMIAALCSEDVRFPAAILAYTDAAPVRTVLYPFADFSPELQAMKWAAAHGIPVQFCDLPSDCLLAHESESDADGENGEKPAGESVYARLERVSGTDSDTFWEYCFEGCNDFADFCAAAAEYGKSLRECSELHPHDALREAFMRRCIAEAEQKYGRVAVVTGAFHTAALQDVPFTDIDKKHTDTLKTVKSHATLMPYSFYRLSQRSGYGAGSKAPGFFEILWNCRLRGRLQEAAAAYLARLAAFQRQHGYSSSPAEVIEALRLADTLTLMRGGVIPALSDLRDAAVTCLGHGSFGEISLACADVEIGTKIGSLPEGSVHTSVQEDFLRQLHDLKLERFRTASAQETELDLRENLRVKSEKSAFLDLYRSRFLHQLRTAGVEFGTPAARQQDNATWAERWSLKWTPETEIQLVEASLTGDTVEQTARAALGMRLANANAVTDAADMLADAFLCGLPDAVREAVSAVQRMTADCASAADAGKTLGRLSGIARFGSIRRIDSSALPPLLQQIYLRFCLSAGGAAVCDANAAAELIAAVTAVNDACIAHDFLDDTRFLKLLMQFSESDRVNALISGFAAAILTERGSISAEQLSTLISRRLSRGTPPADAAAWFEGLAKRNRRALIGRLSLWEKLCDFISGLDDEEFKPVLLALRRTFSEFTAAEKSDIAENIGEVLGMSGLQAAEIVFSDLTEDEQAEIDALDDFDFDGI
ncbi:MAG TPA: hypothetical protein DDX71_03950 [Ruminococcus sp.]|nr:hypothetical protein [Ruminococcus sp.]